MLQLFTATEMAYAELPYEPDESQVIFTVGEAHEFHHSVRNAFYSPAIAQIRNPNIQEG